MMRLYPSVYYECSFTLPVLVYGALSDPMNIACGIAASKYGPEEIAKRFTGERRVIYNDDQWKLIDRLAGVESPTKGLNVFMILNRIIMAIRPFDGQDSR